MRSSHQPCVPDVGVRADGRGSLPGGGDGHDPGHGVRTDGGRAGWKVEATGRAPPVLKTPAGTKIPVDAVPTAIAGGRQGVGVREHRSVCAGGDQVLPIPLP